MPRGFGRDRLLSTSPGHTSPSADTVVAISTGSLLQWTTNEASDSGSAGSIQTRLSQFAYSGRTQNTVDNE